MKTVTKYQANDGTQFDTAEAAEKRDKDLVVIDEITRACLKSTPTDCNWDGYIQQHGPAVMDYKRVLMRMAKERGVYGGSPGPDEKTFSIWDRPVEEVHARGIAGRFLDDSGQNHIYRAWHRLACMDGRFREYNQPYFAINPDKATGGEIKP